MSSYAIQAESLGKRYNLLKARPRTQSLGGVMVNTVKKPIDWLRRDDSRFETNGDSPYLWAVRDVDLAVKAGEAVGIIGSNGAGKSTLLKIISKLTWPTEGRISVRGRIGSMLELGVGFNPDLTGRENVYLSGVILGIDRAAIHRKFDEIVEFSGIERFIDQPAKNYSSGMRMRLAFAVIVALEPEILLIDEVLGVGDEAFRKKSTRKMEQLITGGCTVLFVSHNQRAVGELCDRTIHMENGRIVDEGSSREVIEEYIEEQTEKDTEQPLAWGEGEVAAEPPPQHEQAQASPPPPVAIRAGATLQTSGQVCEQFELSEPIRIQIRYEVREQVAGVHLFCRIQTLDGTTVMGSGDADVEERRLQQRRPGQYAAWFEIPGGLLEAGRYRVTVSIGRPYEKPLDRQEGLVHFRIVDESSRRRLWYQQTRPGLLGQEYPWVYDGPEPWK